MDNFDIVKNLLIKDRSIRRFQQKEISFDLIKKIIDLTRYCASGRNLQPLKYKIITEPNLRKEIYPLLAWAGYLTDWDGPQENERPTAYILQCLDTDITSNCLCDDGLQLQALTLGATSLGIGNCIIKSFNNIKLRELLHLSDNLKIQYVVALGYPAETSVIEKNVNGDIKYFRTADGRHHVPKRDINEIIL